MSKDNWEAVCQTCGHRKVSHKGVGTACDAHVPDDRGGKDDTKPCSCRKFDGVKR